MIIDGNQIARLLLEKLADCIQSLPYKPGLAFIRIGEDPASISYVKKKEQIAHQIGIKPYLYILPAGVDTPTLLKTIETLNQNKEINGILVQSPLPKGIHSQSIFNSISVEKDVDGFHCVNFGKLCQEDPSGFVACTPLGIRYILECLNIQTSGKHVVIVGRSLIVGKPLGQLMVQKNIYGNATVTTCHSLSENIQSITQQADILIAAMGQPEYIKGNMVKPGSVVIDVGINRITDSSRPQGYKLVGDVDFQSVAPFVSAITPVPGGVGPLTVAMLMYNTLKAFHIQNHLSFFSISKTL